MFQPTLITSVVVWERILELEDEKRGALRYEDVFTDLNETPEKQSENSVRLMKFSELSDVEIRPCCSSTRKEVQPG